MTGPLERLGVRVPVVQAGMGGRLATPALAAAVSEAGGLGTIGMRDPDALADDLRAARERTDRPVAVNLLLPFARRAHGPVAERADLVVTFWGRPRRPASVPWVHQAGSVAEARAAAAAGADGVILQGVEAGGHVRGTEPAHALLAAARAALPADFPLWLAGGIAEREDVEAALAAGAEAAVAGTRFLMTEESGARRAYKQRLMEGRETVVTELFGAGWPGRHRVLWNEACERWLRGDPRGPAAVRLINRAGAPLFSRLPESWHERLAPAQRPAVPFFSPLPPRAGGPRNLLDSGPLYAGETVARLHDVVPAAEALRLLAPR